MMCILCLQTIGLIFSITRLVYSTNSTYRSTLPTCPIVLWSEAVHLLPPVDDLCGQVTRPRQSRPVLGRGVSARAEKGPLMGGPQCRLSILKNGNVPCRNFFNVPVDFKIV